MAGRPRRATLVGVPEPLAAALAALRPLLLDERLVRAVAAGRRRGQQPAWRRAELRPVDLRAGRRLQVVTYDATQAHTRNLAYGPDAATAVDALLAEPFGSWHVATTEQTLQLRVTKKGDAQVHRAGSELPVVDTSHDRAKPRLLDPREPFLAELGVTTADGRVKPSRQDKYRQVEEFVRALAPMLHGLAGREPLRVVDLGCGNAYLTFAAYAHLTRLDRSVELVGVDVKAQAREHNAAVARRLGWAERVRFVEGTIAAAPVEHADVVLALHACDTATDEALARAVRWQAPVVLAAPCCHHDLQRQLHAARAPGPYGLLTRHGILRERFADVLTDTLRAALLRLAGYRVEVVEFVGTEHTPRNVLLRAVRTGAPAGADTVADYRRLTTQWQVTPALERMLAAELGAVLARAG